MKIAIPLLRWLDIQFCQQFLLAQTTAAANKFSQNPLHAKKPQNWPFSRYFPPNEMAHHFGLLHFDAPHSSRWMGTSPASLCSSRVKLSVMEAPMQLSSGRDFPNRPRVEKWTAQGTWPFHGILRPPLEAEFPVAVPANAEVFCAAAANPFCQMASG